MQENIVFDNIIEDQKLLREFQKMMNIKDHFLKFMHAKLREQSFAEKILNGTSRNQEELGRVHREAKD